MPKIEVDRKHALSIDEARKRVSRMAGELQKKYGLQSSWSGDQLSFSATGAKGRVLLQEGRVSVQVELSMLLSMLKSKIEERIKQQLEAELLQP